MKRNFITNVNFSDHKFNQHMNDCESDNYA